MSWKSYNGPPFNSHEFHKLAEYSRFEHRRIMPYSTGLEPMVKLNVSYRTIHEKCIRTALIHVKIGSCKKCTLSFTSNVPHHTRQLGNHPVKPWTTVNWLSTCQRFSTYQHDPQTTRPLSRETRKHDRTQRSCFNETAKVKNSRPLLSIPDHW